MRSVVYLALLVLVPAVAHGEDLEDLARDGYAVVEETNVDGEFEGCEYDKRIPLTNSLIFVCSEYSYSYSYQPEVLILKHVHSSDIKVLINDEEYDGTLYSQ